jgi:hypothetical protein
MRTPSFSAFDRLSQIEVIFIDSPYGTDLIILVHLRRIGIQGNAFRPFSIRQFKTRYTSFMEKSQQRVIIYYFSLKDWDTRKIQKELINALGSDVYSQVQILHSLARFSMSDIS